MTAIRVLRACIVVALIAVTSVAAAQSADLQKQLESAYALTKATADNTDIVTAGAVLVLGKDNLKMCPVNLPIPTPNYYKNGAINQGGVMGFLNKLGNAGMAAGADANATRTFVAGEKFWVTKIQVQSDGVTFQFLTDPFQDVRYHGSLKVQFPKGQTPSADEILATVGQVIKTDGGSAEPEQQQAAADAPASMLSRIRRSRAGALRARFGRTGTDRAVVLPVVGYGDGHRYPGHDGPLRARGALPERYRRLPDHRLRGRRRRGLGRAQELPDP